LKQLLEKQRGRLDEIKVHAADFDESLALEEEESGEEKK